MSINISIHMYLCHVFKVSGFVRPQKVFKEKDSSGETEGGKTPHKVEHSKTAGEQSEPAL